MEHCTEFKAVIYSTVIANGTRTVEFEETLVTQHNPEEELRLENFRVEVLKGGEDGPSGTAVAKWTHRHQCLEKYMVRVQKPDKNKGEKVEFRPAFGDEVKSKDRKDKRFISLCNFLRPLFSFRFKCNFP